MVNYKLYIGGIKEGRIIDLNLNKLEKLDKLTYDCENELELKKYLYKKGLINEEEFKKKLTIAYRYNGKIKRLPVLYSCHKKYLNMKTLRYKIDDLSDNLDFLEKLANHYCRRNSYFENQLINVQDIRAYVGDKRNNNGNLFYSGTLSLAINDLINKATVKKINPKTNEVEVNYRGLRDLILLIYNFEKTLQNKNNVQNKKNDSQINLFDIIKTEKQKELNPYPKDWNTGLDDEPLFPPNSEELEMYKKYLDEQQINEEIDKEFVVNKKR